MGWLDGLNLPSLAVEQNKRRTVAPVRPTVLERQDKRTKKQTAEDALRDDAWARDRSTCRATGKPLKRAHVDARKRGEVAHIQAKSTAPAQRLTLSNVLLLSAEMHALSDARTAGAKGKRLLEIKGRNANKAITFIRRDERGRELWRRTSTPDGFTTDGKG